MVILNYFEGLEAGIEFLIALGSIIGVLGLVIGIIGLITDLGYRKTMIEIIIISIILIGICGIQTGIRYFSIYR